MTTWTLASRRATGCYRFRQPHARWQPRRARGAGSLSGLVPVGVIVGQHLLAESIRVALSLTQLHDFGDEDFIDAVGHRGKTE
jgi:hypothetical protein